MKRILWTAVLAIGGFAIGWQDQGDLDLKHVLLVTVWFAAIGFGFGSIFARHCPSRNLFVLYWVFTLALVAMIFSAFVPAANFQIQVAVAGMIGALLGLIIGLALIKLSSFWRTGERSAGS